MFLVNQIEITKAASGEYVESMRRLQERNRDIDS